MSQREFSSYKRRFSLLPIFATSAAAIAIIGYLTAPLPLAPMSLFQSSKLQQEKEVQSEYIQFLAKYGKVHASKEETLRKYEVFRSNLEAIKSHNSLGEAVPFQMEVNWFADMTDKEIEEQIA